MNDDALQSEIHSNIYNNFQKVSIIRVQLMDSCRNAMEAYILNNTHAKIFLGVGAKIYNGKYSRESALYNR